MNLKGSELRKEPEDRLNTLSCYQCKRCTNGCPVTFAMDLRPDEVIRRMNLGQMDRVLACNTIWICSSCETCTTRCPNEVDIAGVMDFLKERALESGVHVPQKRTYAFHASFLKEVEKRGRVFEGGLMQRYMLKSGDWFRKLIDFSILDEICLGIKMFLKGRMPLWPERIPRKARKEVRGFLKREK